MGRKSRTKKERRATQEAAARYALADAELLLADAARTLDAAPPGDQGLTAPPGDQSPAEPPGDQSSVELRASRSAAEAGPGPDSGEVEAGPA